MEYNLQKVFTNNAISIATFFGGPLAAGFLISKNYKVFGDDDAARNSIFIGIITTIILLGGLYLIPENIIDNIPNFLIPAINTLILNRLVEKFQGQKIKDFLSENGQKAPNWQAALYGCVGFLIIVLFIITIPNEDYEKKIIIDENVVLYFNKQIDESKSQMVANTIKQSGYLEGSEGSDLFLSDEKKNYRLKFVITDTSVVSDSFIINDFNRLENFLNYNLNLDKRIEIGFTDINLAKDFELTHLNFVDPQIYQPLLYLQAYEVNEFHTIYYNSNMVVKDVKKVENSMKRLKAYFPSNQKIDIIFLNNGNDYTIKFFVLKNLWKEPANIERLKSTVDYIKNSGIDKKINLVLIDNQSFNEVKL